MTDARELRAVDLRAADARARHRAEHEFDRPLVLEAGAGTGKTTALVARVLAWILGPGWSKAEADVDSEAIGRREQIASRVLRGVVAITFTEKAAAEMGERIAAALGSLEAGEVPVWLSADAVREDEAVRRERARALRGALDHLAVQTIHAWCRGLLVTHALDAGLHPNLEIDADGRARASAVRTALDAKLRTAYGEPGDPAFLALAGAGIGPSEIEAALLVLLESDLPAGALDVDPASPERIRAFVDRSRAVLAAFVDAADGRLTGVRGVGSATSARIEEMLEQLERCPPRDRSAFAEWIRRVDGSWQHNELDRVATWANAKWTKGEASALDGRCEAVAAAAAELSSLLAHVLSVDLAWLDAARTALAPLLTRARSRLRAGGVASFSALLGETRALLRDRPQVTARVRAEIDQLLVDEFQDTDRRQCDIIRALALDGERSTRPGLFLVGDPKQSIYGWRNADLAAYDGFVAEVLAQGGSLERLSVNFRSVPAVLDEVERVVAPVMVERRGMQPAFQPLVAGANVEPFERAAFAPVEHWVPAALEDGGGARVTRALEAAGLEARALARDLRELHDEHGAAWREIGVLFRGRSDWEIYLSALRAAGVPYAVEGDRSYYRRREIIEAASWLRVVIDPNDPIAMLTWLRSVAVGAPDAALIPLWSRELPAALRDLGSPNGPPTPEIATRIREAAGAIARDVPGIELVAGWEENVIGAVETLAALRESFASEPADVFVERLRERSLLEATEAARYLGAWRCANLGRFFGEMQRSLADGEDVHDLLRRLRNAVASEEEAEESRPVELVEDAVAVMTIHGAKGLDFEHVYLPQLHKGVGRVESVGGAATFGDGYEYELFGAPTLDWDRVQRERDAVAETERVRLLYVAMTRAKSRLVLSGLPKGMQVRGAPGQMVELLAHRDASPDDAREWMAAAAEGGRCDARDSAAARWFFPALDARPDPARQRREARPAQAPDCAAAVDRERLRALSTAAARRMDRRVAAAASDHPEPAEAVVREAPRRDAELARRVGTAVHAFLEQFDFAADFDAELERGRRAFLAALRAELPADADGSALQDAADRLDRIVTGALFGRLRGLSRRVVARELPVLLPPAGSAGPVGYTSGSIDLVYRDDEERLVVVDYKTDTVEGDQDAGERARRYADQGDAYQRAVREALGLSYTPRFELWFLSADRIVEVAPPDATPVQLGMFH